MIKVMHENIDDFGKVIKSDKEAILLEIGSLKKANDELKLIWKGIDAKAFQENMDGFLSKLANIPKSMDSISNFVNIANIQFKDEDELYARDLVQEITRYKVK